MEENIVTDRPLTTKKKVGTVHNPSFKYQDSPAVRVLRITEEDGLTRIDFVCHARAIIWANMEPDGFIRPVNTSIQLTMVKAANIPMAPDKHWFKNRDQALYYTLYFPALSKEVKAIDIIEKEVKVQPHNFRYFNFYEVSLVRIAWEIIKVDQN